MNLYCDNETTRPNKNAVDVRWSPLRWTAASLAFFLCHVACAGAYCQNRPAGQQPIRTELGFDPEDDTPLVDREPFDRILAKDGDTIYTLAVKPLNLEGPIEYKKSGLLRFELLDRVGLLVQLPWSMVQRIERFEEIIVEETRAAYRNGDLDKAFRNLIFLFDRHGENDPLVKELLEQFWYRDAQQLIKSGNHDLAATVLEELYQRNPGFSADGPPVLELLAAGYGQRMRAMAQAGDIDKIIAELEILKHKFPVAPPPIAQVIADWKGEVDRQGQEFLDGVEAVAQGNDPYLSHQMARRAIHKLPQEPRSWSVYERVFERYPVVLVGVVDFAAQPDIRAADNWSARRSGGLLQRQLVDLIGLGEDGGRYEFADGRIVPTDEFGLSYRLEILPSQTPGEQTMTAMELANRLALLIREDSPEFYFPLAKIVETIAIVDHSKVEIRLRQPFARFESLLRVPYRVGQSDRGVYAKEQASEEIEVYRPASATPQNGQWPIIERRFTSSSQAADALLAGEIDVLDRVYPADLQRLRNDPNIAVRPYVIPSIHMLIPNLTPNPRTRYMRDQSYRRSFLYGVDRERIVREIICGGQEIQGFAPISGPTPTGSDENDLIGYGYDERVKVVGYNPGMALVSPSVVIKQTRDRAREELKVSKSDELNGLSENDAFKKLEGWLDEDATIREPTLILAHPASEIATTTCQSIQQMLSAVGRRIELRALPAGVTRPPDDEYDLLYAEFTLEEPLVDLRLVLGEMGLAKHVSPTIEQLLSELDVARNWVQARQLLRQIHEQCNADASVLPLWQTINFFAYRRNVHGLGDSQVRLYDNVERWTIDQRMRE